MVLFTDEYVGHVEWLLHASYCEREPYSRVLRTDYTTDTLKLVWEPGDATRYECHASRVPGALRPLICIGANLGYDGTFQVVLPYYQAGDYLTLEHFTAVSGTRKVSHYTRRKYCQIAAAIMHASTDANDPPDYNEAL